MVATEIEEGLLKVLDGEVVPLEEEITDTALEVTTRNSQHLMNEKAEDYTSNLRDGKVLIERGRSIEVINLRT